MNPTVGRIVHYRLTEEDAEHVNRRRTTSVSVQERMPLVVDYVHGHAIHAWPQGAQAHIGLPAFDGQELPMLITRVRVESINGQVFLEGNDVLWVVDIREGIQNGQWHWPEREG
jgi:hypothetical protein